MGWAAFAERALHMCLSQRSQLGARPAGQRRSAHLAYQPLLPQPAIQLLQRRLERHAGIHPAGPGSNGRAGRAGIKHARGCRDTHRTENQHGKQRRAGQAAPSVQLLTATA